MSDDIKKRLLATFDDGPLDGTRLAKAISEEVPGLNAETRMNDWRKGLRQRMRDRVAERMAGDGEQ